MFYDGISKNLKYKLKTKVLPGKKNCMKGWQFVHDLYSSRLQIHAIYLYLLNSNIILSITAKHTVFACVFPPSLLKSALIKKNVLRSQEAQYQEVKIYLPEMKNGLQTSGIYQFGRWTNCTIDTGHLGIGKKDLSSVSIYNSIKVS